MARNTVRAPLFWTFGESVDSGTTSERYPWILYVIIPSHSSILLSTMGIPPSLSLFTVSVSVSAAAMVIAAGIYSFYSYKSRRRQSIRPQRSSDSTKAYLQLIGNTPLCQLHVLSGILGRKVFVKMESMNPGGTGKDRAAKYMLQMACQHDVRHATKEMFEGTSGSTGIALAYLCNAMGLKLNVVMPDDQAEEKRILLERLGVTVTIVPPCGISNAHHYVNTARRIAKEADGIFLDQFENLANFRAHYEVTGPELWEQTKGTLDAFVMSAGTGGTIAGVSRYAHIANIFVLCFIRSSALLLLCLCSHTMCPYFSSIILLSSSTCLRHIFISLLICLVPTDI